MMIGANDLLFKSEAKATALIMCPPIMIKTVSIFFSRVEFAP